MKSTLIWVIVAFALGCILIFAIRGCHDKQVVLNDIKTVEKLQEVPVNHWIDVNGRDHATKELAAVSSEAAIIGMKGVIEYQAKLLKVKPGAIKGFGQIAFVDTGKLIVYLDSINATKKKTVILLPGGKIDTIDRHFEWIDSFTWVEGFVGRNAVQIDYRIEDTLTHREYMKKKWLLGKGRLYMDASLQNPNAYIKGMTGIRINDKMPGRFSVGPYVGFDLTHMTIGFGISLQYALFRF